MDISLPLEEIQSIYRFSCSLTKFQRINFIPRIPNFVDFSLGKRKSRAPSSQCRCSLLDHGLKPRPMLKVLRTEENGAEDCFEETRLSSDFCGQIKKLVITGRYKEAIDVFEVLECEKNVGIKSDTYDALMTACIGLRSARIVKRVFCYMVDSGIDLDVYMMNKALGMHVKCGMMNDARQLFDYMTERNLISWNTMIGGLVDCGEFVEAFRLFLNMLEHNLVIGSRTIALIVKAACVLSLISQGEQLHALALKMDVSDDIFVSCSLIDMYSKCGSLVGARLVFDSMPQKTTVGWNSIIAGYALHGYSEEALSMYYEMQDLGIQMDHFTYSIILQVCTRLGSLEHGKQAHAGLMRNGFTSDIVANTALVDFYSKWGRIEEARNVFEKMPRKNVLSWNSLIFGYGTRGRGIEAVELFERMIRERTTPSHITFLAVLSACCNSGLSDQGWEIFKSMSRKYSIKPRAMHYTCMVELLGREGLLNEAYELIQEAPFEPTVNMWAALLTACRIHNNFVLGKLAAEKLYGMEPEKLSNYIVLLNIYNAAGKSDEAAKVVHTLSRKGLRMSQACTWIEIKKEQHCFFTNDRSHPETKSIYSKLNEIMAQIQELGYDHIPKGGNMLPDVDEDEQSRPALHSEKLAIAFGLVSTPTPMPLQLVQNHRICGDCHDAIKLISLVSRREIVFRDGSRFHRFKDGACSCGDYW